MGTNLYLTIFLIFWFAGVILGIISFVLSITLWKREDVSRFAVWGAGSLVLLNYSKYVKPEYIKHSKILDLIAVACFLVGIIIVLVS
jgi:hypothetical protein